MSKFIKKPKAIVLSMLLLGFVCVVIPASVYARGGRYELIRNMSLREYVLYGAGFWLIAHLIYWATIKGYFLDGGDAKKDPGSEKELCKHCGAEKIPGKKSCPNCWQDY